MKSLRSLLRCATFVLALTSSAVAFAGGLGADPERLGAARDGLAADIEGYRGSHPEAFEALANVKGHKPEVYKALRNPIPTVVTRELRGLGPSVLLPMLEALAFRAPARGAATDVEWDALTAGMLEAVGVLRDARSAPVLAAVFESSAGRPLVAAAAARAMGRVGTDALLANLMRHTGKADPLRLQAIQGLGELRRIESARHLAGLLEGAADDATAQAISDALGVLGSSWAWRALGSKAAATGADVRAVCARALVPAFVQRKGDARNAAHDALLMVESPLAIDLLGAQRAGASAETVRAIDAILVHLDKRR